MTTKRYTLREMRAAYGGDDAIIERALLILQARLRKPGRAFQAPGDVKDFLRLCMAQLDHEEFGVMWLDSQHRLIEWEPMFIGTLTQTSVYPREVVRRAMHHNAAACVFAHNHPSGAAEPSRADEFLTTSLKTALVLVDVRVLDHIVVGATSTTSFAERGLL